MSKAEDQWTAVDHYLNEKLLPADPALDAALRANAAAELPQIDVSPTQGKFLQLLAQMQHAKRILEIGTLGGYSTICLARGLAPGGWLLSLELNPHHAETARSNVARAGLSEWVEIRVGAALDSLAALVADHEAPFDLIFIDADKPNIPRYFDLALQLSRPGTLILCDNVIRDGEVADATSTDANVQGARALMEKLAGDRRVSATALQTVGSKGYDGFAMMLVLGD